MSGFTGAGIDKDTVTTTQQAPLGFKLTVPDGNDGNQVYTYIKAAAAIAQGIAAMRGSVAGDSGYGACVVGLSADSDMRYVGCAQQTGGIPSGSYGFVLTQGVGLVKVNSASNAGDELVMHSALGELDDAAAGPTNGPVGVVLGTPIAAPTPGLAYVNFAG